MSVHAPAETPKAVLFDFGGVLTTSVLEGFADFSEAVSGDRRLLLTLLSTNTAAKKALGDHEEGRLDDEEFESVLAATLAEHGVEVEASGLIARMQSHLRPDRDMLALVQELRGHGIPVGLVSNSLGRDCYAGHDLDAMFDAQAISGLEGVRKPSRRLYEIACERLEVKPTQAVMIDDLEQNITSATRLGMGGIVHRDADTTRGALAALLGQDLGARPIDPHQDDHHE